MEILQLWNRGTGSFMHPNHLQMIWILGWACVVAELFILLALYLPNRARSPVLLWLGYPKPPWVGDRVPITYFLVPKYLIHILFRGP